MTLSFPSPNPDEVKTNRWARPRWQPFYYLLAAFNVFAVAMGLYLNQRIMDIYRRSIEVNQVWEQRLADYAKLEELAAAANAPGNDAFYSHNVAAETTRMRAAVRAFKTRLAKLQAELRANESADVAAPLLQDLRGIETAMREMGVEAELIFASLNRGQAVQAGARMAAMDRKYRQVNRALSRLRDDVSAIQARLFRGQEAAASSLEKSQYVMVAFIFLMVGGATAYGRRLAGQMEAVAGERERSIRDLAVMDERNRLAREIHDALAQNFTAIVMHLEAACAVLPCDSQAVQLLKKARDMAREGLQEARRSVHALRSQRLEGSDLPRALGALLREMSSEMAGDAPVQVNLRVEGAPRLLSAEVEAHLLRIAQEALANALRHAEAATIEVELSFSPQTVALSVRDDGRGFDREKVTDTGRGFGLVSMGQRAASLGGRLTVESHPGQGTAVRVAVTDRAEDL